MMSEQSNHPSPQELSAFSMGQLPPHEAEAVETHVSNCEACCDTMLSQSAEDTFVTALVNASRLPTDETIHHDDTARRAPREQGIPAPLANHPRYEIVGLVGQGGMGAVYQAKHRVMERTVALKIINQDLMRSPEAVDRFHREVKTAAQLTHPNIVTSHDAEQAGDLHFLVMEYVDGIDLAQTVKEQGALPIAQACEYIRQAAMGLQHAHEQGMVHRDIKPHNLMVAKNGKVKVLDFGLASLSPEAIPHTSEQLDERGELTVAGSIMGTPDFISPEQADDARQADIRSDIYSLGTTLYFLLSGRAPFSDGSVLHKLKKHAQAEPESLQSLREEIPDELTAIVSKMLAKDPGDRYQTPAAAAAALEPFTELGTPVPEAKNESQLASDHSQTAVEKSASLPRKLDPRIMAAGALALVTCLVLCIAVTIMRSWNGNPNAPIFVGGGTMVASSDWSFQSGALYLPRQEPGVSFGIHQSPDGQRDFSYVLLLRYPTQDLVSFERAKNSGTSFDGNVAAMRDAIQIGHQGLECLLEMQIREREITSAQMKLAEREIDYSAGRVFLVDLTGEQVDFRQIAIEDFEVAIPSLENGGVTEVAELAKKLRDVLEAENSNVRAFLAGAPLPREPEVLIAEADLDESRAEEYLRMALDFEANEQIEYATVTLKLIVDEYPQTVAATKAAEKLKTFRSRGQPKAVEPADTVPDQLAQADLEAEPDADPQAEPEMQRKVADTANQVDSATQALEAAAELDTVGSAEPTDSVRPVRPTAGPLNSIKRLEGGARSRTPGAPLPATAAPSDSVPFGAAARALINSKGSRTQQAFRAITQLQLRRLEHALDTYKLDTGAYPTHKQGLRVLSKRPGRGERTEGWNGPYVKVVPVDPWKNQFEYRLDADGGKPVIKSLGPDGKADTNDDVRSRQLHKGASSKAKQSSVE